MVAHALFPLSRLAAAARRGDCDLLREQLRGGAEVDLPSACGWTALADAARCGHTPIIRQLITHGADPNTAAHDGITPLMLACRYGHGEAVEVLLDSGSDPNLESVNCCTAFEHACQGGHPHIARAIFHAGGQVSEAESLLYIRAVLASYGLRCIRLPSRSRQAPRWAVDGPMHFVPGDLDPVKDHIQHISLGESIPVARIELRSGESFQHHEPALPPDEPGSSLPDPQWRYKSGWCGPAQAVLHGELPPDHPDQHGFLPMLEATRRGHAILVQALIRAGADPEIRPRYGLMRGATLMMNAAEIGSAAVIQVLLDNGADPDASSATEWTALMTAAARGHLQAVNCLTTAGADMELRNAQGKTAINLAIEKGHPEVARALLIAMNRSPRSVPK
jgi:ankyrin repeat protein